MKPEEAIKRMKENRERRSATGYIIIRDLAIEALEKQVAQKPYMESDGYADGAPVWEFYCPMCDYAFEENKFNYCPECGQRISWGDEE